MPELAFCRAEDLDALRQLRQAGWRIGIVTNGMTDNQLGKIRSLVLEAILRDLMEAREPEWIEARQGRRQDAIDGAAELDAVAMPDQGDLAEPAHARVGLDHHDAVFGLGHGAE